MSGMSPPAQSRGISSTPFMWVLIFLSLLTPFAFSQAAFSQEATPPESLDGSAVIVTILGTIDGGTFNDFRDTVEALKEKNLRFLIIKLDTPGGTIEASRQLAEYIDNLGDENIETFGWVPNGTSAYSGGTLVAFSCRNLVMGDNSRIGDVQPIDLFGNELPEKIQTTVRADMRRWAREQGYPTALAEAMVTKELGVLRVRTGNRSEKFLTDQELDDLPAAERAAASVERIVEVGEILTIDEKEAFDYGFISYICQTPEQLLNDFNLSRLNVTTAEEVLGQRRIGDAGGMALDAFRGWGRFIKFLLILALALSLVIELKLPGVGLGAGLALLFLFLFMTANYADGGVGWIELTVLGLGLVFVSFELFVIPGFGIAGILGLAAVITSMGLSFQPVDKPLNLKVLSEDSLIAAAALLAGLISILVVTYFLPGSKKPSGSLVDNSDLGSQDPFESAPDFPGAHLQVGHSGLTLEVLRPAGKVDFDGTIVDVVSVGDFIEKSIPVTIVEMEGNRIVVQSGEEA